MKGIKIQTDGGKFNITFEDGFIVIGEDVPVAKTYTKKGKKENKYESFMENGKKKWRKKDKFRSITAGSKKASIAMKESWKRRKEQELAKENKEYDGLVNLNQDLEE